MPTMTNWSSPVNFSMQKFLFFWNPWSVLISTSICLCTVNSNLVETSYWLIKIIAKSETFVWLVYFPTTADIYFVASISLLSVYCLHYCRQCSSSHLSVPAVIFFKISLNTNTLPCFVLREVSDKAQLNSKCGVHAAAWCRKLNLHGLDVCAIQTLFICTAEGKNTSVKILLWHQLSAC